ncbi:alpha/beta fold hydrolase [Halopiger goleimassiliensis]|uniref:alpha/beta fold hydrolase n=1 Tax=Halopiger goleimassiliensis TaxID=1293048 RepID=UPI0006778F44|nr:alpha/beta hydrolase [Halopiger goleimassiliensis]
MAELALEDGTLWYETTGDGPPLVFVHGGWMNGQAWRPQVEYFADDYQVVTMDVRGHGQTGATDRDRYSIDLFTDDLETLLAHLEIEAPILCGLSLGSMVVQQYLQRHPDGPSGAILAGAVRSMPPLDLPQGLKPFVSPLPALATTLSMTDSETAFRSLLTSIQATTGQRWLSVDPSVRAEALEAVGEVSRQEFRKIFGALYRFDPPDLGNVTTPTLVVHGEQEAPLVKAQGEEIASAVADGQRLTFDDAGHLVNQDRPRAFNAATEAFLPSVSPTA